MNIIEDDILVLFYHPIEGDYPPGKILKDRISNPDDYKDLAKIKNWRNILSPSYISPNGPFYLDGKHWASINNYYIASKYFYTNPEYSAKFSVESKISQLLLNKLILSDFSATNEYIWLLSNQITDPNYTKRTVQQMGYNFNLWCIYRSYVARIFSDNLVMEVLLKTGNAKIYLYNSETKLFNNCDFLELVRNCLRQYKIKKLSLNFSQLLDDSNIIGIYNKKRMGFISGPINLTEHYSKKYNKHIYIFGDIHVKQSHCPLLSSTPENTISLKDFLVEIATNTDKPLDIFLEVSYKSKKIKNITESKRYKGYIDDIYREFASCFQIDKRNCKYKNVRFHYSDIRSYEPLRQILLMSLALVDNKFDKKFLESMDLYISYDTIEKSLKNINLKDLLFNLLKINKQIQNIPFENVRNLILSYKKSIPSFYYNKEIFDILRKEDLNEMKEKESVLRQYGKLLSNSASQIMDLYVMARMFRKFKKPAISETPENIIIYVGNTHAAYYRFFLKNLEFDLVNVTVTGDNKSADSFQCLDIRGFNYPFFQH